MLQEEQFRQLEYENQELLFFFMLREEQFRQFEYENLVLLFLR